MKKEDKTETQATHDTLIKDFHRVTSAGTDAFIGWMIGARKSNPAIAKEIQNFITFAKENPRYYQRL